MIQRPIYTNQLLKFKDKHVIKIITGIRRAGKSTLLKLFKTYAPCLRDMLLGKKKDHE